MNRIILLILTGLSISLFSQSERLSVSLTLFDNKTEISGLNSACSVGTDIIDITLRMYGKYDIKRTDFLNTVDNLKRSKGYLRSKNFDYSIYGGIYSNNSNEFTIEVNIWEKESDKVIVSLSKTTSDLFDILTITDSLSIEALESFTGEHIELGNLVISSNSPGYSLYIDDIYVGQSIKRQGVLAGKRKVSIAVPGLLGENIVYSEELEFLDGEDTEVNIELESSTSTIQVDNESGRGTLNILSKPVGANITVSGIDAGLSPQSIIGVKSGTHKITISSPGFIPFNDVAILGNNEEYKFETNLSLDLNSQVVKDNLISQSKSAIIGGGTFAGTFSYMMSQMLVYGGSFSPYEFTVLMPKTAHLVARDYKTAAVLNLISLLSVGSSAYFTTVDDGFKYKVWAWTPSIIAGLYDIIMAPYAAGKYNKRKIAEYEEYGLPIEKVFTPFWSLDLRVGGGNLLSLGANRQFLENLTYTQLLGFGFNSMDRPGDTTFFSTTGDLKWYPDINGFWEFYTGVSYQVITDFKDLGFSFGGLYGFELSKYRYKPYCDMHILYGLNNKGFTYKISTGLRRRF